MPVNFNQWYSGYNSTIRYSGCALCCGVDVSAYYGTSNNHGPEYFYNNYWGSNGYSWQSPCATFTDAAFSYERIRAEIDAGRPVVVRGANASNQHWVVVRGYTSADNDASSLRVLDPYNPETWNTIGRDITLADAMSRFPGYTLDRMKLTNAK